MSTNVGAIDLELLLSSNKFNKQLGNVQNIANKSGSMIAGSFKKIGMAVAAAFSVTKLVQFGKECINVASNTTNAWIGLNSVLTGQGKNFEQAKKFINDYVSDGLVPLNNAVAAYKNLTLRGYSSDQIQKTMNALKNSATFARQSSYSLGDAVQTATEGLKNENSVVVDNAGVTKNVAKMWEDYAKSIGKTTNQLTQAEKIQAEVNGILEETKFQSNDAAIYANTYSGKLAQLNTAFTNMKSRIGSVAQAIAKTFIPMITAGANAVTKLFTVIESALSAFGLQADSVESISGGLGNIADISNEASSAVEDIGTSAKKTKKSLNGLRTFDILNNMSSNKKDDSDTSSSSAGPEIKTDAIDFNGVANSIDNAISKKFEEFFKPLQNSWNKYGEKIFTNLKRTVNNFKRLFIELGSSFKKVWTNGTAETMLGHIFSITSNIIEIVGNLADAFANAWANAGNGDAIIQNICDYWNDLLYIVDDVSQTITDFTSSPEFQEFANGMVESIKLITDVISNVGRVLKEVWDEHGKEAFEQMLTTATKLGTAVNTVWKKIQPFVSWCIETMIKRTLIPMIDRLKSIWKVLEGVIDFVTGVFSGDWKRAWEGIKEIFIGMLGIMKSNLEKIFPGITSVFEKGWNFIKSIWQNAGGFFGGIWNGIKNAFGSVSTWFHDTFSRAWQKVKDVFSSGGQVFNGIKEGIDRTFKTVVNSLISGINRVVKVPFEKIQQALNKIRNVEVMGYHPFYGLPYISVPSIPYLAEGGYFKANQPTLAMVGDNMTQDEVVTPIPKMQEALRSVLSENHGNSEVVSLLKQIISLLKNMSGDMVFKVGEEELARAVLNGFRALQAKSSKPIFDFL